MAPPRKSHKKSKTGCLTCRQRRIKCDEQGRPCNNCSSRQFDCVYENRNHAEAEHTREVIIPESSSESGVLASSGTHPLSWRDNNPDLRLVELELMHHWTTKTYAEVAVRKRNEHDDRYSWQVDAVKGGLRHDFLLLGLFALTALHISVTETSSRSAAEISQFKLLALYYHNEASTKFRQNIDDPITSESALVILTAAVVNVLWSLAMLRWRNPTEPGSELDTFHAESLVQHTKSLFHMSHGFWAIFDRVHGSLEYCPFHDGGNDISVCRREELPAELSLIKLEPDKEAVFTRLIDEIELHSSTSSPSTTNRMEMYSSSVGTLRRCFAGLAADRPLLMALFWMSGISPAFIDPLDTNEPMALVLLAHWAVLLHEARGSWDVGPTGKLLVSEISSTLLRKTKGTKDEDWVSRLLEWPQQQVGLEMGLNQSPKAEDQQRATTP